LAPRLHSHGVGTSLLRLTMFTGPPLPRYPRRKCENQDSGRIRARRNILPAYHLPIEEVCISNTDNHLIIGRLYSQLLLPYGYVSPQRLYAFSSTDVLTIIIPQLSSAEEKPPLQPSRPPPQQLAFQPATFRNSRQPKSTEPGGEVFR
jgi:hypothetical protein